MQSNKNRILVSLPRLKATGLLALITGDPSYDITEVSTIDEISELISKEHVDLILIEEDTPGVPLQELVVKTRQIDPDIQIVAIMHNQPETSSGKLWMIGVDAYIFSKGSPTELAHRVARSLRLRWLSRRIETLEKQNKELWQLAVTDALTGLMNRGHFNERVEKEFERVQRYEGKLGCIILDVDFFKKINDNYGHLVGDHVLRQLGRLLKESLRTVDIIARYGGEEFVALAPETIGNGLSIAAEKLRSAIEGHDFTEGTDKGTKAPKKITISLGLSSFPDDRISSAKEMLDLADQALYKAKQNGRNRVEIV